jgi:3-deoxy-D-manno-octulosonic-acid transferase
MRDGVTRGIYSLAWWLLTPFLFFHLIYRARRQPDYLHHVGERFGFYPGPHLSRGRVVWIHAVSVGETRAAEPLIKALAERYQDVHFLLTHTTPTGRATPLPAGPSMTRVYLPYDYAFAVRRFLSTFVPVGALFMETEVWPNLVAEGAARGLPMVLANARLSKRSASRAKRVERLIRPALARLRMVLAQAESDGERLTALGASNVLVVGNVKFDLEVPAGQLTLAALFGRWANARPVVLAASTREGEEAMILKAWRACRERGNSLLVLVPRHPQRVDDVEKLIIEQGWSCKRRSQTDASGWDCDVVLGDSMGEMLAYYASATVAYVGGGLLPFGTHNLIEPCAVGCPVLLGKHTFNFAEAARQALSAGAALQASDADALVALAVRIVGDPMLRDKMASSALAFAKAHRGATSRSLEALAPMLDGVL